MLAYLKIVGGETDNLTFGPEGPPITVEEEAKFLEDSLRSSHQTVLLAVDGGELVGIANFTGSARPRLAHRGEIGLSVKKAMWGQGVGTRLMEALIRFARETAGARIISLEVRSDNARAIALYKRFGFVTMGTFPGFLNINGEDVSFDLMYLRL